MNKILGFIERVLPIRRIIVHSILMVDPHFKFYRTVKSKENLKIGKNSVVSYMAHLDLTASITIGEDCMITDGVRIYTHSHYLLNKRDFSLKKEGKAVKPNPIVIEDNVIIYSNAMIMPSVKRIHKGCMILSGAILTRSTTAPYQIWGGNPAKLIKIKEV